MPRKAEQNPTALVAHYARIPLELKNAIRNHAAAHSDGREARETERILRAGIRALYGPDAEGASSGE